MATTPTMQHTAPANRQGQALRFLISGGGTGGHIFPALAIANALKAQHSQHEFLFVGALGRMEMQRMPEAGYEIEGLYVAGLQRKLSFDTLLFPFRTAAAVRHAAKVVRRFAPHCVIGTGGYASGPVLWAAQQRGIPTLVQEQNALPGLTNKLLGRRANAVCVAYAEATKYFPEGVVQRTGNPVRADMLPPDRAMATVAEARAHFGLDAEAPVLLVAGGSLGARSLNEATLASLSALAVGGVQVLWHTGATYFDAMQARLAALGESGVALPRKYVSPFLHDMPLAYRAATLALTRAGALTLSELAATRTPAIVVPSPYVAADHQTHNARALAQAGAAVLLTEQTVGTELTNTALPLLQNAQALAAMQAALATLDTPGAAMRIATRATELALAYVQKHSASTHQQKEAFA